MPPPASETPTDEQPDEATILRAMPPIVSQVPGLLNVSRDNIQIVTERIVDKVDPPHFFPLIGPAQCIIVTGNAASTTPRPSKAAIRSHSIAHGHG